MAAQVERSVDDSGDGGALPYAALIQARERVRRVLEPHLGPDHAMERANNITQALVFDDTEPVLVAQQMLRQLPHEQRGPVAEAVGRAFRASHEEWRA